MRVLLASVLFALTALTALAVAQDEPPVPVPENKVGIAAMSFLSGQWAGTADDGHTWETMYTTHSGGEILGASKEFRDGRLVMFEFERFLERAGVVYVIPHPFGKARKPFKLTSFDAEKRVAVFEDPENDFPRTLTYACPADDRLEIGLAGEMRDEPLVIEISLKRVTD